MPSINTVIIIKMTSAQHSSSNAPVIWNRRSPTLIQGIAGIFTSYTLHFGLPVGGNSLEVTVFASPTRLFVGRSKINLFISWLPTVFFNQCVTLGNNKLFYKGSTMCWKEGAGDCTTRFCPREPVTSLTFTCIKSECPAQARMGECEGFKWLVHNGKN